MKRFFKYFGFASILLFSFYYTEKINDVIISNSRLFNEIKYKSNQYNEKYVNATINGKYIIPGIEGKSVSLFDSYYNMKDIDVFNVNYLLYDNRTPIISINNNKDKIIRQGNPFKKNVSLILKDNKNIIDYSYSKNINITRVVNINTFSEYYNYEQVNNEIKYFNKLETKLNKKHNSNICVIDNYNEKICRKNKKYLVMESVKLSSYNIVDILNEIENGIIIYIDDDVTLSDYKVLLKEILYKDLNIVWLSTLINEERD